MKRFLASLCSIIFTLSISLSAFANPQGTDAKRVLSPPIWMPADILVDNENTPIAISNTTLPEEKMGYCEQYANGKKFTNFVDGYSIVIPSDMAVDLSFSDVCTTFKNTSTTLRVFKERFETNSERLSYLEYSNKFINNTTDHTLKDKKSYSKNGREYHILMWSRKKLALIQNDKNFYTCIDVCEGNRVYTLFFKSGKEFTDYNTFIGIADSLLTFDPTIPSANAYNKGYKKSALNHLGSKALNTYDTILADNADFKMGIFCPDLYGGFPKIEEFENTLGYEFPIFLHYTEFSDTAGFSDYQYAERLSRHLGNLEKVLQQAQNSGKSLELTLQTPLFRPVGNNMVYEILDGKFEKFLTSYINLILKYPDVTLFFRPFNEMNGDWCTYSSYHTSRDTEIYVELYKYLYTRFSQSGCNNLIWVWNPNERSFPNFKWNHQDLYYPGDEYVDVYGITGYNNGTYYEGETWRSFEEIYTPIYERALKFNEKPIMITEFSCSSVGGDKVQWIKDMFTVLPGYDKIKLGIWWHSADYNGEFIARPYFMDTPDGMLEVFDKYLN